MTPEAYDETSDNGIEDEESLCEEESISEDESLRLSDTSLPNHRSVFLPDEIILNIISHLKDTTRSQGTLWSCCLVSRQWYSCAVSFLYAHPDLYGKNFDPFVRTICPSINPRIRKSPYSTYVRQLDMGKLVYQGSKSLTARILRRVKDGLEEFIAPRASFAVNCCAALSKCSKLWLLDMSLVSEHIPVDAFLRCMARLENLRVVFVPHTSLADNRQEQFILPPNLRQMHVLHASYPEEFTIDAEHPQTVDTLTIQHWNFRPQLIVDRFMSKFTPHLRVLRLMDRPRILREVLDLFPNLKQLSMLPDLDWACFLEEGHHSIEFIEALSDGEDTAGIFDYHDGLLEAVRYGSLQQLRGICLFMRTLIAPDSRRYMGELNSVLLSRFDTNRAAEALLDIGTWPRTPLRLREMVEQNMVGVWPSYEQYDIREELLHSIK